MNRKYQSFIASLVLLVLFGVMTGCRETPINNNPVPRGSQFVGEINGVVRDGNTGAPLSGVTLRLIGPDGDLSTTTNADGIYVFRNLQAGTYKIAAAAPAGYAPTRTRDVVLTQAPNQSTGVAVVRVARDFRFFTANAAFAATLQYQTPDGRLLPVPAGTPVFINFVKQVNLATGLEETVGDVQVALVRDSVRANGAVSITGLPAVGALSQAGPAETPRFIVPTFTVGGVTYGDPTTAKALNYPIAGLRPGTTFTLPPTVGIIRSSGGTAGLSLLATNMNSRTNFGTTDTIFVAFNKSIKTFRFFLSRTQTPYTGVVPTGPIASTDDGSLIATVLPAGAVPQLGGLIVGANQAFAIRLNRPFITGSDHRLDINASAEDGEFFNAFGPSFARTFTTVPGIRLLSVTAGGVTLSPTGLPASAVNVDSIIFRFDLPPGRQLVGPYFTRGPRRNVRFASGSTDPNGGTDEVGRAGVPGEANRIDCVGVINGANLSFGYRTVVGTTYQIHTMLVDAVTEQPVVSNPNVAPGTPGNFRSNLPGDFGVGVDLNNLSSVYSSFRIFRAAVNQAIVPRIVSVSLPANPGDSIRITFSRPMRISTGATTGLAVGDIFADPGSVISFFRTATEPQPYGLPTGPTNPIPVRISSISSSGDTTTYFLVRDQKRVLDDAPIPFEGNTSYTLEILGSMAAVPAAGGRRLDELAGANFPFRRSARTAGQRLVSVTVSGVRVFPTPPSPLPIPDSGTIVLRFAQPIRQDVEYRTRGVGQNFELERTSSALGQIVSPPTTVDLGPDNTTIFIDPVGVKGDCTITFNYRGLYRNATYALRLVGDGNSNAPTNFFNPPNAQAVPDSIRNVRWAAFPNDPGVGVSGNYNANTGSNLNVAFTVTATPPRLIAASTDTNSTAYPLVSSANPLLANSIRLYFDREMDRGGTFLLTRVASPYGLTGPPIPLRPTWSADGKVVSLVPQAGMRGLTDTSRTLEAGTTYRLIISSLNDVNGNPFSPPVNPIIFNTQPGIRLVGVTVGGQTFTSPGQPIKADSVGTIKLIFNQNIAGSYNVRGALGDNGPGRFIMVEDSTDIDLARVDAKLLLNNGVVGNNIDSSRAAFVDSLATVNNNEITINYVISAQRLTGRSIAGDLVLPPPGPFPNPPESYPPRTIRFSIDPVSFVASLNGGTTAASDSLYYNIQVTPRPRTIRGPVRGDLGVSGFQVQFIPKTDDIYINNKPSFNRFGPGNTGLTRFAFYFSTEGVPAAQSFPDLVISSVRNAAESVSQAAKQTVSTVRGWWKRFRGE